MQPPPSRNSRLAVVKSETRRHEKRDSGSGAVGVEIAQQGDLGAVVDHLAVDVGDEIGQRRLGERALGGPARPGEPLLAEPAHARQPGGVGRRPAGRAPRPPCPRRARCRSPRAGRRSATRPASGTRRRRCARCRHAIVVTGGGAGSGNSQSIVKGPLPGWSAPSRGRTFQLPATGSHRYSASVSPARRGRSWCCQWWTSWSVRTRFHSISVMAPLCTRSPTVLSGPGRSLGPVLAVHAVWSPGRGVLLWAEDGERPAVVGGALPALGPAAPVRGRSGGAHGAAPRQARHAHAAAPVGAGRPARLARAGPLPPARRAPRPPPCCGRGRCPRWPSTRPSSPIPAEEARYGASVAHLRAARRAGR